jgi:hypothetical protein
MSDQSGSLHRPLVDGGQNRVALLSRGVNKGEVITILTNVSTLHDGSAIQIVLFSHPSTRGSCRMAPEAWSR